MNMHLTPSLSLPCGARGWIPVKNNRLQFHFSLKGQRAAMNESDALDLVEKTVWTIVLGAGPAVIAAMTVGLVIALFQALTQIQEMTLTFVPKILIVFLTIGLSATFVGERLSAFTLYVYGRIEKGF